MQECNTGARLGEVCITRYSLSRKIWSINLVWSSAFLFMDLCPSMSQVLDQETSLCLVWSGCIAWMLSLPDCGAINSARSEFNVVPERSLTDSLCCCSIQSASFHLIVWDSSMSVLWKPACSLKTWLSEGKYKRWITVPFSLLLRTVLQELSLLFRGV
jgi:hypothetical protein